MSYEIENKLRPPVELMSTFVFFASGIGLFVFRDFFLVPYQIAIGYFIVFFSLGAMRFRQALSIIRYQRGLKATKHYEVSFKEFKIPKKDLMIGRGFLWVGKHTSRNHSLTEDHNSRFITQSKIYTMARDLERSVEGTRFEWIAELTSSQSYINPLKPLPEVGGNPWLHGVGYQEEKDIFLSEGNRNGHHLVCGSTRVGKTRKAELYIAQDIRRNHDDLIVIIDPKGDPDLLNRVYVEAERSGQTDKLSIFHLGYPDLSCTYNPLNSFTRGTEVSTRVTGTMPTEGSGRAFKDFAWQFSNIFTNVMIEMGNIPDYKKVKDAFSRPYELLVAYSGYLLGPLGESDRLHLNGIATEISKGNHNKSKSPEQVNELALIHMAGDKKDIFYKDLKGLVDLDDEYYSKISSSVRPFLEKVTSGEVGKLLSPDEECEKPTLNWNSAYSKGGIVYIGLDALTDPEVASAIGEATFQAITALAGRIYKHNAEPGFMKSPGRKKQIIIHGDEFSDLIGPRFLPLVNKAGGAGVNLVLYTQTISDLQVGLGSAAAANQVIGNINTLEFMRVPDEETAKTFTSRLGMASKSTTTAVSGVGETDTLGDFTSKNEDRISRVDVPMLHVSDITGLPKGQSFILTDGSKLYKVRAPLPSKIDFVELPKSIEELIRKMDQNYKGAVVWETLREE